MEECDISKIPSDVNMSPIIQNFISKGSIFPSIVLALLTLLFGCLCLAGMIFFTALTGSQKIMNFLECNIANFPFSYNDFLLNYQN